MISLPREFLDRDDSQGLRRFYFEDFDLED